MVKRTETQWRALFSRFDKSGLSAAAFCREHELCPQYFSLRCKQLGQSKLKTNTRKKRKPRFSKVALPESMATKYECRIILPNGVTVVVSGFLSGEGLSDLLQQAMQLK